jgi:NRPS condensation-like uncharacterized protein
MVQLRRLPAPLSGSNDLPFTWGDELCLLFATPGEPFWVHIELRLEGRLDGDPLREAMREAADRHPMARARVLPARPTDHTWRFRIEDCYDIDPLEEIECGTEAELDAARDRLLERRVEHDRPPMFRARLAHCPDGDRLIVGLQHVAGDGIGMMRFLRSIQRAYAGEADSAPAVDLVTARDLRRLLAIPDRAERRRRMEPLRRYGREARRTAPTRLAVESAGPTVGQGCVNLSFDAGEEEQILRRRQPGTTLNDLLIAALQLAIDRWNTQHGQPCDRIGTAMAMNARPREWRYDVLSNVAVGAVITTRPPDRRDFDSTLAAVAGWTNDYKRTGGAGYQYAAYAMTRGPVGLKRLAYRHFPERAVESSVLSNLGRLEPFGDFGPGGGRVVGCWFSPPLARHFCTAFGAVSLGGGLGISMRYRHSQFDPDAAHRFMDLYHHVLLLDADDRGGD